MMQKFFYLTLLVLTACVTPKNMVYFADAPRDTAQIIVQQYSSKIQKDDLLSIVVSSKTPELVVPFNQVPGASLSGSTSSQNGYLVGSNGDVVFPMLGKISVAGLTHVELSELIEAKIVEAGYLNDPTVRVNLLNYKISVLGEVKQPGVKKIDTDRITILDALGLAGDMTVYGERDKVSVIRELDGKREIVTLDLSNKELFNSPYYYLHPNDIVYVQPNKKQQRASVNNPYLLSTLLSGTSLLVALANIIIR